MKAIADRFRYKPTKAKMALSKLKKIEQMTIIEEPNQYDLKTFHTNFDVKTESGNLVVSAKNLQIGYGEELLAEVSFNLYKGQKLAIIGENGKGKSTLLKTLMGFIPKLGGDYEYGYHVEKEYFDQQLEFQDVNSTILDDFYNEFQQLTTTQIRQALGAFLFSGDDVFKEIKVLSGGEKVRCMLAKMMLEGGNFLLLDEPTNHLDLEAITALNTGLINFKGNMLITSHDQELMNTVCNRIIEIDGTKTFDKLVSYDEYLTLTDSRLF